MIQLRFDKDPDGLLPAVAQDHQTGEVLMVAFINEAAWRETLATGCATYWSRSRRELWRKGDTSGHVQQIKEILVDCDEDAVIFKVEQVGGAACHTGYRTCFHRRVAGDHLDPVGSRVFDPEKVYRK
jgi:phosphoribosyl-AMP cyclohydrolase